VQRAGTQSSFTFQFPSKNNPAKTLLQFRKKKKEKQKKFSSIGSVTVTPFSLIFSEIICRRVK
jgi:hypothetical protein